MVCSHRYWRSLSALLALMASRPPRVSIRLDWRSAASAMLLCMICARGLCSVQLISAASGKVSSGIHTSCPPISAIAARISRTKGRSIRLASVSEARKSRRLWNS
ncbi:hypothetical protein D3C75_874590 [compost metagenome]